ncbi:MAG: hypothetical protein AB1Z98_35850 [Nannocystaceae bacterium]
MRVDIQWRPDIGLATIDYDGAHIDTEPRFEEWKQQVLDGLRAIATERSGRKFPLVVGIDELRIVPALSERYGKEMVPVVSQWCEPIARYGTAANVRVIVSVEAMRGHYSANIFSDFDDAVRFVLGGEGSD